MTSVQIKDKNRKRKLSFGTFFCFLVHEQNDTAWKMTRILRDLSQLFLSLLLKLALLLCGGHPGTAGTSDTRSFMLLSASVELHLIHTFSGVPMQESLAPEHSGETALRFSWTAPGWQCCLPMKVAPSWGPLGGMSQTAVLTLLGIHSTK